MFLWLDFDALNYFAHGMSEIGSPERLAGTAFPDWLGAADRSVRLDTARLDDSELAAGVRRHYHDDRWFHATGAFLRVCADVTDLVRATPDYDRSHRGWFLGHVLVEMLVDRFLIRDDPRRLDDYYEALESIDRAWLLEATRPWLTGPSDRLGLYVDAFLSYKYLYGYHDDDGLFARLRGLARRVGLPPLPGSMAGALPHAARAVEDNLDALMREPCSGSS